MKLDDERRDHRILLRLASKNLRRNSRRKLLIIVHQSLPLLLLLFLKRMPHSIFSPRACEKLIAFNPKISGINQFHSHIVGRASNRAITTRRITNPRMTPTTFASVSMRNTPFRKRKNRNRNTLRSTVVLCSGANAL